MKICFISGSISNTGGTESVGILIANELSKRGNEVTILSMRGSTDTKFKCEKNIKIESLHLEKFKNFFSRKVMPYVKIYRYLKREAFDIVIDIDAIYGLYTIPLKIFLKCKVIVWEHFNCRNNNGVKNRDRARKLAVKCADSIVTLTKKDKDEYYKMYKVKTNIECILNPSIIKNNSKCSKDNIVLACGRLCYTKNFQELLEIWKILGKDTKDWKLYICGEGEDRKNLENIIYKENMSNVMLLGNQKNMDHIYDKSKIMVLTSRNEGLPMVLLEAQGHGIPIVAYDCYTGPAEIINDSFDGYLIKYGDKKSFANALIKLINDDKLRNEMSCNSFKSAERFDIDIIIAQWEELINKLL